MRSLRMGLGWSLLILHTSAISSQEPLLVPLAEQFAVPEKAPAVREEQTAVAQEPVLSAPPQQQPVVQEPIVSPRAPSNSVEPLLSPSYSQNPSSEYAPPVRREERPRIANTEALLYQRAAFLAQQRTHRLETRKWTGNSAQRPTVGVTTFYTDLNHPLGWPYDWGYLPVWYVR